MITLQAVSVEDIPILFTHQDDPVVRSSGNIPIRERADFFAHWQRLLASDSILKRGIWIDGQLIGSIACFERNGLHEIGYAIARQYWGKGIASEALRLFLLLTTDRPLSARVTKYNYPSLRVLQKNGFLITGEDLFVASDGRKLAEYVLTLS
jgi:RimJ/RimL family protein N-acetyltransferase